MDTLWFRYDGSVFPARIERMRMLQLNKFMIVDKVRAGNTSARIFRAGILIAILTAAAKLVSLAKEVVIADVFGRGGITDAYLTAYVVPALILNLTSGTIISILVPYYAEEKEKRGPEGVAKLSGNVCLLMGLVFVAVAICVGMEAGPLVRLMTPNVLKTRQAEAAHLLYLMSPYVVLNGMAQVLGSLLNAEKRVSVPAILQGLIPLGVVVFAWEWGRQWQGAALCAGTCIGALLQTSGLIWTAKHHGIHFQFASTQLLRHAKSMGKRALPVLAGGLFMSSAMVTDQVMSISLGPGSISALAYGGRLVSLLQVVAAGAAATAILPYISEMAAKKQWVECEHTFLNYMKWLFIASIPATLLFCLASNPIVRVIYQHGAFHATDTRLVAHIQAVLLLQIPFYIAAMTCLQLLFSINASKWFAIGSIANFTVNLIMNAAFMKVWGIIGIAASTTIMYLWSFTFLFILARRELTLRVRHQQHSLPAADVY